MSAILKKWACRKWSGTGCVCLLVTGTKLYCLVTFTLYLRENRVTGGIKRRKSKHGRKGKNGEKNRRMGLSPLTIISGYVTGTLDWRSLAYIPSEIFVRKSGDKTEKTFACLKNTHRYLIFMQFNFQLRFKALSCICFGCLFVYYCSSSFFFFLLFTARCTTVQSAVLRSHVVCLSVRLSLTLVDHDHIG